MQEVIEKLERINVRALDEILGVKFPVLDEGFVRVIDYMGDDSAIVQAARVSYGKGTKKLSEDEGLIRYLLRHTHTTPFEMCELKLHIRIPMDAWRQAIRHRTANVNEYSTRYSEAIDEKQKTTIWRTQSVSNRQGSTGCLTDSWDKIGPLPNTIPKDDGRVYGATPTETPSEYLSRRESQFHEDAKELYEERLRFGVAKEVARKDLPLSTYTEAYWKCDLHNILHFLSLRMDKHAQLEIRSYANVIGDIVSKWCPISWNAWNDYNFRRNAMLLSARDKCIIAFITQKPDCPSALTDDITEIAKSFGWMEADKEGKLKTNREREECEAKLKDLGFSVPW